MSRLPAASGRSDTSVMNPWTDNRWSALYGGRTDLPCQKRNPELYYPNRGGHRGNSDVDLIATECLACPIQVECLDYALGWPAAEQHGIWGGLTAPERKAMLGGRRPKGHQPGCRCMVCPRVRPASAA